MLSCQERRSETVSLLLAPGPLHLCIARLSTKLVAQLLQLRTLRGAAILQALALRSMLTLCLCQSQLQI
jgi:hypothetical protein